MKSSKDRILPSGNYVVAVLLPYSRLILEVICMAIGGWVLLDTTAAHAALIN